MLQKPGKGASATVFLAEDRVTGRTCVVKKVTGNRLLLKKEADLLQKLCHPAIPKFLAFYQMGDDSFLVMERIEGESLAALLWKGVRFSEREIRKTGSLLAEIFRYLHSQEPPVVYRDLKPDHVILKKDGCLGLVDFGTAIQETQKQEPPEERYGTKRYAAPEQVMGFCDTRTDIYGLGALLDTLLERADGSVSEELFCIINRCRKGNPEKRYQNMQELIQALEGNKKEQQKIRWNRRKR